MIVTCKKHVPLRWIIFAVLPWAAVVYQSQVMGAAFIFSLKKFVDNPAGLTFILSMPGFVSILLAPLSSFLSDRVWTRFGRRKPFIITSWVGIAACMILMPIVPNFWALIVVFAIYGFCNDLGAPVMEVINQEIVPPQQRGRATAGMQWCSNFSSLLFYFIALGRFDDVQFMTGVPIVGEKAIYWSCGLLLAIMAMFLMLGVKETNPRSKLRGQRLSIRTFFTGILDRELWPVYTLIFGAAMLGSGLGAMGNLLYTEQWHYTKQEMGINVAVGTTLNLFMIAFLGIIADKFNRLRAYQTLISIALCLKVAYFCYVNYVLADHRPTLIEMILFGEMMSVVAILTSVVYTPLVYDYVTRNKMGTYGAGASMVTRLTQLITFNGVGLFVWGYAVLFQPPAGEMVRVVLRDEARQNDIRSVIRQATWTNPQDGGRAAKSALQASAWYATGLALDSGRCWEIRLHDSDSEHLTAEKEKLEKERSPLLSNDKQLRDKAAMLRSAGQSQAADARQQEADAAQAHISDLTSRVDAIDAKLATRATNLQDQVRRTFADKILTDGQQVLSASVRPALLLELATTARPVAHEIEAAFRELRQDHPNIIDLRPVKRGDNYAVAISTLLAPSVDPGATANDLRAALQQVMAHHSPGLLAAGSPTLNYSKQTAIDFDLIVVEEPLDTRLSPVTRVANAIQGLVTDMPTPDHRLAAIARSLRVAGETEHVRVEVGSGDGKTISVVALLRPGATTAVAINDAVGQRLHQLVGDTQSEPILPQARAFYDRIVTAAATQRLTVAQPFVAAGYAPIKYDYMCGYIWMFFLGLIGLGITFAFGRRERKGLIRKRGVEEAQAS